jgi:DNA-binding Lrp family transcriptional regulator
MRRVDTGKVDPLDLNILRETSRGRVMWWGSLDPRLSIREVGHRLRVDPTTIWNRLRAWQRTGFLLGYSVVPNPSLLGPNWREGASESRTPERRSVSFGISAWWKERRSQSTKWARGSW